MSLSYEGDMSYDAFGRLRTSGTGQRLDVEFIYDKQDEFFDEITNAGTVTEFERCRPWIEAAMQYSGGTHDFSDIANGVSSGRMQFWPAPRGAAITEILVYPKKKVLNVFLAGGDMAQVLDMIADAKAWGKCHGCTSISMTGRKGWARVLNKHGWKEQFVTMAQDIA
jgi:hypothetical protein